MEQIERIKEMERCLDVSETTLKVLSDALDGLNKNKDAIRKLFDYYGSPFWRADFEDDEAGRIPKDLKRGVLSEDAVYDLVTLYSDLNHRMKQACGIVRDKEPSLTKLLTVRSFDELDFDRLMQIYAESNRENAEEMYPDEEADTALDKVIDGFCSYLQEEFFRDGTETYRILEIDGEWVAALRLYELPDRRFYIEALETEVFHRRLGYATQLLHAVMQELKAQGPFTLCDCVGKRNVASLCTHLKCGFQIVQIDGYSYLSKETNPYTYGLEYRLCDDPWKGEGLESD